MPYFMGEVEAAETPLDASIARKWAMGAQDRSEEPCGPAGEPLAAS